MGPFSLGTLSGRIQFNLHVAQWALPNPRCVGMACDSDLKTKLRHVQPEDFEDGG